MRKRSVTLYEGCRLTGGSKAEILRLVQHWDRYRNKGGIGVVSGLSVKDGGIDLEFTDDATNAEKALAACQFRQGLDVDLYVGGCGPDAWLKNLGLKDMGGYAGRIP